jgi:hypothetical protein
MSVTSVAKDGVWRAELRERGETRALGEAAEPYKGVSPGPVGPVLPLWEYSYPIPEIESGERRERLADSGMVGACLPCNGTGHQPCKHCDGKGFVECPVCHGRARVVCRRCRGRGRIADELAERRARSDKPYIQVHAERLATDAAEKLADLSERLRQEYGVPLPPSAQWMPTAPASGETVPCPDCVDGKVKCSCGNGKLVCDVCKGSGHAACAKCGGSGRVLRYKEIVRRFDTRMYTRSIPPADAEIARHIDEAKLRRATGEEVWEGVVEQVGDRAPEHVPSVVWAAARELVSQYAADASAQSGDADQTPDRHVVARQVRLSRIPVSRVRYTFLGHPFEFLAVGKSGTERFWADTFPPRWSHVGRFFRRLVRDLGELGSEQPKALQEPPPVSVLDDYRARRGSNGLQRVRIVEEPPEEEQPQPAPAGAHEGDSE